MGIKGTYDVLGCFCVAWLEGADEGHFLRWQVLMLADDTWKMSFLSRILEAGG